MMNKPYEIGVCSGRYQHPHLIHEHIIRTALALCEKVLVFIGQPESFGEPNNPWTWKERKELLSRIFDEEVVDGSITFAPLLSIGRDDPCEKWARHIINHAEKHMGKKPNLMLYGSDKKDMNWYYPGDLDDISEHIVSENIYQNGKKIEARATLAREYLSNYNVADWKPMVNPKLYDMFNDLHLRVTYINIAQQYTMRSRGEFCCGVIVVNKEGNILLVRRAEEEGFGKWCCPGGNGEAFETIQESAKRELLEETGLSCERPQFLGIDNGDFTFVVNDYEGDISFQESEVDKYMWVSPHKALGMNDLYASTQITLEMYVERLLW